MDQDNERAEWIRNELQYDNKGAEWLRRELEKNKILQSALEEKQKIIYDLADRMELVKQRAATKSIFKCGNCGSFELVRRTTQTRDNTFPSIKDNIMKKEEFRCQKCGIRHGNISIYGEKIGLRPLENNPDVVVIGGEKHSSPRRGMKIREAKRRKAEEELARTYPAHYARLVAIGAIEDSYVLGLSQLKAREGEENEEEKA